MGDYEQAKVSIYRYAELGWLEGLGRNGLEIVREFRVLAKVDLYAVEILSGKIGLLKDYVRVLQNYPKGMLDGLVVIMLRGPEVELSNGLSQPNPKAEEDPYSWGAKVVVTFITATILTPQVIC